MIRRVAFRKAALAGVLGALGWEAAARLASASGAPVFDLVRTLGTMAVGKRPFLWWPAGLAMHALVGTIWAIFYAYFFWALLERPPWLQGVVFAVVPAVLAGLVMVPELGYMHPDVLAGRAPAPGVFAWALGWGGPVTIVLGHLVYGVVMGASYTHPVGYRTERRAR